MSVPKLEAELESIKNHLSLLRGEYIKCQKRNLELEGQVAARGGNVNADSLPASLAVQAQSLYKQDVLSDIKFKLQSNDYCPGHRLLLAARSREWSTTWLNDKTELDISNYSNECAWAMINWLYTDIAPSLDENSMIELMHLSKEYQLNDLARRSEDALKPMITRENCVKFYQLAEEIESKDLIDYTGDIVSQHWEQLGPKELESVKAPLLYEMLKRKSSFPLHRAIKAEREDVVFLYLIEFNSSLDHRINEKNDQGSYPLDIALASKNESLAKILSSHNANINRKESKTGATILHLYIQSGDTWATEFLLDNGARLDLVDNNNETVLHYLAKQTKLGELRSTTEKILISANVDCQNDAGETALHIAIENCNIELITLLLQYKPNLELADNKQRTPLLKALESKQAEKISEILIESGADSTAPNGDGDSILQILIRSKKIKPASILIKKGRPNLAHSNKKSESVIHSVAIQMEEKILAQMIEKGVDITSIMPDQTVDSIVLGGSALHIGIGLKSKKCVDLLLSEMKRSNGEIAGDDEHHSALAICLQNQWHDTAEELLKLGASVDQILNDNSLLVNAITSDDETSALFLLGNGADPNITSDKDETALELAVKRNLGQAVPSLCVRGANKNRPDADGNVPLWNAINLEFFDIAETLVEQGVDVDYWMFNDNRTVEKTLLHRALECGNETGAVFLINNRAEIDDAPRVEHSALSSTEQVEPSDNGIDPLPPSLEDILGKGGDDEEVEDDEEQNPFGSESEDEPNPFDDDDEEDDNPFNDEEESPKTSSETAAMPSVSKSPRKVIREHQLPLHTVCTRGFLAVLHALLDRNVDLNKQNASSETALHLAIIHEHKEIIEMLINHRDINLRLQNDQGLTPFAAALRVKNTKAAERILDKEPTTAEQFDKMGRNFLHLAVNEKDTESILFLVQVKVDVNSRTKDGDESTPLHLAVKTGDDFIIRNLTLAGADINAVDKLSQTALHYAAERDLSEITRILLQNGADPSMLDQDGNNVLHLAAKNDSSSVTRILLSESSIDSKVKNAKGKSFLHIVSFFGEENAVEQFNTLLEFVPDYPINEQDLDGNTPLFISYQQGQAALCVSLAKAGSILAQSNNEGLNIFNLEAATQRLLHRILDQVQVEPPWVETERCQITDEKFGMRLRKHHCRHCGRAVCEKVSKQRLTVAKFGAQKPVRVCDLCYEVLTLQHSNKSGYAI